MMKKIRIVFILFFVIMTSVVVFYYKLGVGFGKATVQTVKIIEEVKADFREKNVNPIETILKQTDKILDSIKSRNKKDSLKIKE